jgi:hypothetical protein
MTLSTVLLGNPEGVQVQDSELRDGGDPAHDTALRVLEHQANLDAGLIEFPACLCPALLLETIVNEANLFLGRRIAQRALGKMAIVHQDLCLANRRFGKQVPDTRRPVIIPCSPRSD